MRVTNNMMISNMTRNLQTNIRRLDKTQMQYNTGKRIHKPSDDPVGITRSLKIRADINELNQYKKNVEDATSWLENTEEAVVSNHEALKRLRELMVQGANGVLTGEEMTKIQNEVAEIKNQIISLANTTYSGDYVFSGKRTNEKLLSPDGSYNIDVMQFLEEGIVDHRINYEVGIGEYIPINTIGTKLFEAANLTMSVRLPDIHNETKETEFLGAKIKLKGVSTDTNDPPDPDEPLEYNLDITIAGIGQISLEGLGSEEDIYNEIKDILENIDDYNTPYNTIDPHPTKPNLTFVPDTNMDTSISSKVAWTKLLTEKNIPADINNLTFDIYKNNQQAVGIVARPQKAGLINLVEKIEKNLKEGKHEEIDKLLGTMDRFLDQSLVARGEIGARVNRAKLISDRIEDDIINLRDLQSKLEDADIAETAMQLMNEENVYRASLQVGARIIQPTLLDFLR